MALALQIEGEFERFSRSNRASTQRISNLIIQVPSVADQQSIVDVIEDIDKKISAEQNLGNAQNDAQERIEKLTAERKKTYR